MSLALLLALHLLLSLHLLLAAAAHNDKISGHGPVEIKNLRLPNAHLGTLGANPIHNNITTYIEKSDNILRVPNIKKVYDEHQKSKKKTSKKSPKRTVQKIIKKNRSRKKMYLNQATSMPTKAPVIRDELDQFYAQEELSQKNENSTTIQVNHQKKRKWNVARYPMPFQHMVTNKNAYRRSKRSEERKDMFILTDLDEIEFLKHGKEANVINAHMKNYW